MDMPDHSSAKILVIDHDAKGCSNNLLALAAALKRKKPHATVEIIRSQLRGKAFIPLLRLTLTAAMRRRLATDKNLRKSLYHFFFSGDYPSGEKYDAVISTLGVGEAPGAFIAQHWQSPGLHIGTPRRMPKKYFDTVIANPGIAPKTGEIELELPPTRLMPEMLQTAGTELKQDFPSTPLYTLLIGGPAADVHYTGKVWQDIYAYMKNLSQTNGCRWLVSTSPRTPAETVEKLKQVKEQEQHIAALSVFTGAKGEISALPQFIGAADKIFVTAESVSMLGDAMASGVPVYALSAQNLITNDRINGFLTKQLALKHFQLINLDQKDGASLPDVPFNAPAHWTDYFWRHLETKGKIFS